MSASQRKETFGGIYTALVTPMHEDGSIDYDSLVRLTTHQIDQGVKGFYVGGSTGEGFLLTGEERQRVLETVVGAAAGRAVVLAHIGCIGTMDSIALAKHAERQGVDAISAVVPFYYKLSPREIQGHYEAIMASVAAPMIVYHFPGATGVSLSLDFYEGLSRNPQCIGVKFTSLNLFEMQQIRARCGEDFLIFNGHDEVYASGALAGADGAIGSTFNIMPGLFVGMHRLLSEDGWKSGRTVQAMQAEANRVIAHMVGYDVIPYEKYMLYLQGIVRTPTARQPLRRFTPEERSRLEAFFESSGALRAQRLS
ncbi:N-acetylneuraminate lyase [Paenibacillus antri]|uniref:N-acetylneuraminate lyase n=1 Tax=Paenibacillus antri TaxID=2582848 RepID=A0A5R9GC71_9BACL|nr:dihydrodipicolinate synthase family protein [Paenibacillus antri]TLS53341.1 N-acetylneuraminate lyase [Paenibacillus antri]